MLRRVLVVVCLSAASLGQMGLSVPAHAGGGGCGEPITTKRATVVRMKGWCFGPTIVHLREGAKVTWVNRDRDRHNVAGANYLWGSRPLRFEDRVTYRFEERGTYPYLCQFHPGMIGAVVVGNGKATQPLNWRDEAVTKVRSERKNERTAALPGSQDADPPAGGTQADAVAVPTPGREVWPAEWFVVLGASLLVCVFAVVLARRRGSSALTR